MLIRKITKKDMRVVQGTMADSFEHDPLYSYFVNDNERRKRFLTVFMHFRLLFGIKKGATRILDDGSGVAVWIPPGIKMRPMYLALYGGFTALLQCAKDERKRILDYVNYVDDILDRHINGEYWHLAPLCVSPERQGQGLGSALLRDGLARTSKTGLPCVVTTQTLANKAFYEKNGFTTLDHTFVAGTQVHNILLIHNN